MKRYLRHLRNRRPVNTGGCPVPAPSTLGRWGEKRARRYLARQGYAIRAMNEKTFCGEIDIIAEHNGILVFVEVKTRGSLRFGYPEEAVTSYKRAHCRRAAFAYLCRLPFPLPPCRFDIIGIVYRSFWQRPIITHCENVPWEDE